MEREQIEPVQINPERLGAPPDMRVSPADASTHSAIDTAGQRRRRRMPRLSTLISFGAAIVGITALATSAWIYAETRRETLRLATELAQVRVSLDLYSRSLSTAGTAPQATSSKPSPELAELSNRVAILEQNWRGSGALLPSVSAPSTPASPSPAASAGDDCLPSGMRILVAAGDSYPICGQNTVVTIANVDNGFISLADGTMVVSGGTTPLVGTKCMLGVTSGGDEGLTGYAEIRVAC